MNRLEKLILRIKCSDELEYKKKLRKKQAEELGIHEAAETVVTTRGDRTEERGRDRVYTYNYDLSEDLNIFFRRNVGLHTTTSLNIKYKDETVYRNTSGQIKKFKPCKWIDLLTEELSDIERKKKERENKKKRERWGMDRDCDSKIFNESFKQFEVKE